MSKSDYHHKIQRGIEDGTVKRRDGEILYSSSKDVLIQIYRTRAVTLNRRNTEYARRLRGEIIEFLSRVELTSEQEIGLVIFDEVGTAKSYLIFVGKTTEETFGILYVEAATEPD